MFKFTVFLLVLGLSYQPTFSAAAAAAAEGEGEKCITINIKKREEPDLPEDEKFFRKKASRCLTGLYVTLLKRDGFVEGTTASIYVDPNFFESLTLVDGQTFVFPKLGVPSIRALENFLLCTKKSSYDCTQACIFANLALYSHLCPVKAPDRIQDKNFYKELVEHGVKSEPNLQNSYLSREEMQKIERESAYLNGTLIYLSEEESTGPIQAGDYVYMHGHPDYAERYATGTGRGQNLFCLGYNDMNLRLYIGYSSIFLTGPKTAREIQWDLARDYFDPERDESIEKIFQAIRAQSPIKRALDINSLIELKTKYT